MLAPPCVVGTELVQGTLPETAAAEAAGGFGACVEALEPSPGNCVARCGLTDAEAFRPIVASDGLSLLTEPDCGTGNVVRTVEVGTLSGSDPQPTEVTPVGRPGVGQG
jgi:hypothetical protein